MVGLPFALEAIDKWPARWRAGRWYVRSADPYLLPMTVRLSKVHVTAHYVNFINVERTRAFPTVLKAVLCHTLITP